MQRSGAASPACATCCVASLPVHSCALPPVPRLSTRPPQRPPDIVPPSLSHRAIRDLHLATCEELQLEPECTREIEKLLSELQQLLIGISIMQVRACTPAAGVGWCIGAGRKHRAALASSASMVLAGRHSTGLMLA